MKLVIVESPAKCKKISSYLGKDYIVKASYGHIRDLGKGLEAIDISNNYLPKYIITPSKKKVVSELKKYAKKADEVIIASDLDREGEAIGFHVAIVLGLDVNTTKRIVFNQITRKAVQNAIDNPRLLDRNLFNAQQARRILDRLLGFTVSPVLWKYVRHALSAGRCQSPALNLIYDKKKEILSKTNSLSIFSIQGEFNFTDINVELPAQFTHTYQTENEASNFLRRCKTAYFDVSKIKISSHTNNPPPPFITSTLQQSASSVGNIPPKSCMQIAQKLYEAGKITYMRTDSTTLSNSCMTDCEKYITENYSSSYFKKRVYKQKQNSQEAHEAIRPVYIDEKELVGEWSSSHRLLYGLIWKRTVASQMASKKSEKKTITIGMYEPVNSNEENNDYTESKEKAIGSCTRVTFPGYTILYAKEDSGIELWNKLENIKEEDELERISIIGTQTYSSLPPRFTEASLIKMLEKKGIGRPSTYSNIISTILDRDYVVKKSTNGIEKEQIKLILHKNEIKREEKKIKINKEKNKLFITPIGEEVALFLNDWFSNIMNYAYTSDVEKELDKIASGSLLWNKVVHNLYISVMNSIQNITAEPKKKTKNGHYERNTRLLGEYNDMNVYVFQGKKGIIVQLGEEKDKKSSNASYYILETPDHKDIEDITLEDTLCLFKYPQKIGEYKNKTLQLFKGPYGLYLKWNKQNYGIPKDKPILTQDEAIEIIKSKENNKRHVGKNIYIIIGPYGPYIKKGKTIRSLPKSCDSKTINVEECEKILSMPKLKKKWNKK